MTQNKALNPLLLFFHHGEHWTRPPTSSPKWGASSNETGSTSGERTVLSKQDRKGSSLSPSLKISPMILDLRHGLIILAPITSVTSILQHPRRPAACSTTTRIGAKVVFPPFRISDFPPERNVVRLACCRRVVAQETVVVVCSVAMQF